MHQETIPFPRTWCEGVVAQLRGDKAATHAAFTIIDALLVEYLALIYLWTGESDLAFEQLTHSGEVSLSHGGLRLHPYRDPLRGDPRFEKIVASFAPK